MLMLCVAVVLQTTVLWADYREDIGYTRLSNELGTALPDGSGVGVTHVEAKNTDGHWMPDTGNTQFIGKTITDKTGDTTGSSGHATGVGQRFYGNTSSMAPDVTAIDAYEAGDWMQLGFLGDGYLYFGNPFQPVYDTSTSPWTLAAPARVANHSWVGSLSGGNDKDVLRRLDFAAWRDEYIQITAVSNITGSNSPLLNDAFNSITVGRTDGSHPMGTLALDDVYTADRSCPLVVAPLTTTSSCAPVVASAAALLIKVGRDPYLSTDPATVSTTNRNGDKIFNAERLEAIKAAILAGAQRVTHNTDSADQITDYTQDVANGMDRRFGAGQIDIYNSYHIIAAGEQNSAEDKPAGAGAIGDFGFDVDASFGGSGGGNTTGTYTFTPTAAQRRLYASLVWNLHVDGGTAQNYDKTAVLYDLNLALYDVTVSGYDRLVAHSSSTVDNAENLWAALVPGRNYRMEVTVADGQTAFDWDYALAWRMETPPDGDGDGIPDDWEVQNGLDYTQAGDGDSDLDNDRLSNVNEYKNGTDPDNADTDGDGQTDGIEVLYQSDPLNPNDTAEIHAVPAVGLIPGYLAGMAILVIGLGSLISVFGGRSNSFLRLVYYHDGANSQQYHHQHKQHQSV
jgi:hypothetical protein